MLLRGKISFAPKIAGCSTDAKSVCFSYRLPNVGMWQYQGLAILFEFLFSSIDTINYFSISILFRSQEVSPYSRNLSSYEWNYCMLYQTLCKDFTFRTITLVLCHSTLTTIFLLWQELDTGFVSLHLVNTNFFPSFLLHDIPACLKITSVFVLLLLWNPTNWVIFHQYFLWDLNTSWEVFSHLLGEYPTLFEMPCICIG